MPTKEQFACVMACEGVTFAGDSAGLVKRMAEVLREFLFVHGNDGSIESEAARAVLAQVRIEPQQEADAESDAGLDKPRGHKHKIAYSKPNCTCGKNPCECPF
jgi:hypothetical protein